MNFSKLYFALSIICLIVAVSSAQSVTIHVPADQPTIQAGIDAAIAGDTVLVADGTYTGDGNRDIDFGGKGVVLKSENGPDVTVIDCQASSSDRHSGFNFHSGEDTNAVVEGFSILNAFEFNGGGIRCDSSSSPKIINNTISGNSPSGIYCAIYSNPTISNNTITGNSRGRGIFCINSNPTISNNIISGNSASNVGGGGGIYCFSYSNPTISNNTISGNSAFARGGGILCLNNSNPTISNNTITGNRSSGQEGDGQGGGIHCELNSNPTISNNIISGNAALDAEYGGVGGGIFCSNSNPTISNNIISGNSASQGGGIFCINSNPTISNNTISGNSAINDGGAIYCINSSPTISNTIIAFSSQGIAVSCGDGSSSPTLSCSDVYGNSGGDWVGCIADQADSNGNFSLDPEFCDFIVNNFSLSEFSPCLPENSPCGELVGALGLGCSGAFICADANGDLLVNFDDVDFLIDFYFYGGATPLPYLASDLNCDGSVNIADITYLAAYINGTGAPPCCEQ